MQKRSLHSILCLLVFAASAQAGRSCKEETCSYTETTNDCCGDRWSRDGSAGIDSFGDYNSNNNDTTSSSDQSSPSNGSNDSGQPGSPNNSDQPSSGGTAGDGSTAGGSNAGSPGSGNQGGRYARRGMNNGNRNAIIANTVATTALTGAVIGSTIYEAREDRRYRDNYYRNRRYSNVAQGTATASAAAVTASSFPSGYASIESGRHYCGPVTVEAPSYFAAATYRAFFVKPTTSNLDYAVVACSPSSGAGATSYTPYGIDTKYRYGFDVGVSLMLPVCADVRLNYEHFDTSHTSFAQGTSDGLCTVSPLFAACDCTSGITSGGVTPPPGASTIALGRGTVDFKFNALHVLFGQYLQASALLQTHFFAGVNFSSIEQRTTTSFSSISLVDLENRIFASPLKFKGAGPEFGVDFNYMAFWGLKFAGRVSTAILLGHTTSHSTVSSLSPTNADIFCGINPNVQTLNISRRTQCVPEFQGRLGVGFAFNAFNFITDVEVGYESRLYFNALQALDITSTAPQASLAPSVSEITIGSLARSASNFGLSGAYISFCGGF